MSSKLKYIKEVGRYLSPVDEYKNFTLYALDNKFICSSAVFLGGARYFNSIANFRKAIDKLKDKLDRHQDWVNKDPMFRM